MATPDVIMPLYLEICARARDGRPCLGVLFRPTPTQIYCPRCGGSEAGATYVLQATA